MASKGVNRVILIGNCGKDPDTKTFANGGSLTSVSLATSDSYKDKSGNEVDRTEWHNLVFNNKLGEIVQRYVRKGSKLYVEGSIRTRKYQDKQGQDRYITEIICSEMQMLDGANAQGDGAGSDYGSRSSSVSRFPARSNAPAPAASSAPAPAYAGSGGFQDDDIPF